MISTNLFSVETIALVEEFHCSKPGLDPVTTEKALVHDVIHAVTGLGVTLEDEEIVLNIQNLLGGEECLEKNRERCEFMLTLIPVEILVELTNAIAELW